MGKFKWRAYISSCCACKESNKTLRKAGKVMICESCFNILRKMKCLNVLGGGQLKMIPGTNTFIYQPPQENSTENDNK